MVFKSYFKGYRIDYSKKADKDLKKINPEYAKNIRSQFKELVKGVQNIDVKKLRTNDDLYRLRVGDYRAIFEVHEKIITIYVILVGHRKDVYDGF